MSLSSTVAPTVLVVCSRLLYVIKMPDAKFCLRFFIHLFLLYISSSFAIFLIMYVSFIIILIAFKDVYVMLLFFLKTYSLIKKKISSS